MMRISSNGNQGEEIDNINDYMVSTMAGNVRQGDLT